MDHNCSSITMNQQEHIFKALNIIKKSVKECEKIIDCSVSTSIEYVPSISPMIDPELNNDCRMSLVDITFKIKLIP